MTDKSIVETIKHLGQMLLSTLSIFTIKVNKNFIGDDNFDQIMIDRDTRVLELIAYQLKSEQLMKCNEG